MNETNLINFLLENRRGSSSDTLEIVRMILAALGPLLAGVAAWLAAIAVRNTQKIDHSVNSEREKTLEKMEVYRLEVLALSKDKATLAETSRGQQLAAAMAAPRASTIGVAPAEVIPKNSVADLHKAVEAVPEKTTGMVVEEIAKVVVDEIENQKQNENTNK